MRMRVPDPRRTRWRALLAVLLLQSLLLGGSATAVPTPVPSAPRQAVPVPVDSGASTAAGSASPSGGPAATPSKTAAPSVSPSKPRTVKSHKRGHKKPRTKGSAKAGEKSRRAAGTAQLTVSKEAVDVPDPLVPGSEFTYRITISCSSLTEACVNASMEDVLPPGLELVSVPGDGANYTIDYDEATRKITATFTEELPSPPNPEGSVGLPAGGSQDIVITVRVPEDTDLNDGDAVTNTATAQADNADTVKDSDTQTVKVPRKPSVTGTKTWSPSSTVAGSGDKSTISLGAANTSSTATDIDSVVITETDPDLFDNFDVTKLGPVTRMPAGADQVQVSVCTKPGGGCAPDELITGPAGPGPDIQLPAGVDPADITGVVYTFSNSEGKPLPPDAKGAQVDMTVELRDDNRSTGEAINPSERETVNNCAVPSVDFPRRRDLDGTAACADHDILPNVASIAMSKKIFSDTDGDWAADGTAVIGTKPGITATINSTNTSPFPVGEMTITEPSSSAESEFDKTDMTQARLRFPDGATDATLTVTCRDGTVLPPKKFTAPPTTQTTALGCPGGGPAESITVTYTGTDADGKGTIKQGATAGLDVHGKLNDTADAGDAEDGVKDCADGTASNASNGSGSAAGNVCTNLNVEEPRKDGSGTKDVSQTSVPPGQPVTFGIGLANRGNVPLDGPVVVSDPVDPTADPNPFDSVRITGIKATVKPADLKYSLQVYDPDAGRWVAYDADDAALLKRAKGVRIVVPGGLPVGASVHADVTVQLRDDVPDGTVISNCAAATSDGKPLGDEFCSQTAEVGDASSEASLNKALSPSTVTRPYPGSPAADVHATLTVVNKGNVNLGQLTATDFDTDFFDAVDFVSLDGVSFPKGADQVRVDVCTARCGSDDPEIVQGTWTGSDTPGLPAGVDASDVRGIRVTFRSQNGDKIVPVEGTPTFNGACKTASVCFTVEPRRTLRSDPKTEIPDHLVDTVTGKGSSDKHGTFTIPPADADLNIKDGTPKLYVDKEKDAVVQPGVSQPFTLTVNNTGDAPIAPLRISDPIPDDLVVDEDWAGNSGYYSITVTTPDGTAKPAKVTFTPDRDASGKITGLHWDFPGWVMYPGATVTLTFHVKLKGGVEAGTKIPNTFGAGSPGHDVPCDEDSPRLGEVTDDPDYGSGHYCTSTATLTTEAGTAFDADKWVSGNPDLGFYNSLTGEYIPVDDPRCPHLNSGGAIYTRYPCTALVLPGQNYRQLITVDNIGTNPAIDYDLLDVLPFLGDTGVLLGGSDRGTEWDPRPHLAGPVTLDGPGELSAQYTTTKQPCRDEVPTPARDCSDATWSDDWSAADSAFYAHIDFDPGLAPGDGFTLSFPMSSPTDLSDPGSRQDPSLAWNSFANKETAQVGGNPVVLPVTEPPKSGVGMVFGTLRITKTVTGAPAGFQVGPYGIEYDCVVTPDTGAPKSVRHGTALVTPGSPVTIENVPAGAVCRVWETDTDGANSNADGPQNAASITIQPETVRDAPSIVDVSNDYPQRSLDIIKKVEDPSGADHGPFTIEVDCMWRGEELDGYPRRLTFDGAGRQSIDGLPVGAECTVTEPGSDGADDITLAARPDAGHDDTSATVVLRPTGPAQVTVTNTYDNPPTDGTPPPGDHTGHLPDTGWPLALILAIIAALLIAGLVLTNVALRRREAARYS
ncbi:DUF5979 domain-containing protein [Streptomyces sp. NPDC049813]|uniref:DUF5979 domain-containing protein n=1 Tax=Streptomyces sp. NPDC049813 TaxID=3365597 RepID=UPI00379E9E76